jgi:hypothetical protein
MSRRTVLACAAIWALSVIACCFPDEKTGAKPTTEIDVVGDGPAVEVRAAGPAEAEPSPAARAAQAAAKDPAAKVARTPEDYMTELGAQAAAEIREPTVADDAPAEVKAAAKANTAAARAQWVYDKVKLPEKRKYSQVNEDNLNVGDVGWLRGTFRVIRIDSDAVVVRTAGGQLFAYSGRDTSGFITGRGLPCDEVVECYRTGKFGLYTLPVVRRKQTEVKHDPFDARAAELAKTKWSAAGEERFTAVGKLAEAKVAELDKALAAASAEAARQISVPKDGPGQDRIRAKVALEKLEKKLKDEAREKVETRYSVPVLDKK